MQLHKCPREFCPRLYIKRLFARSFLQREANYIKSSSPEGVLFYRFNPGFNRTRLPKSEEILKIKKGGEMMSSPNFRIMIQAVIKSFGRSINKRIENWNNAFRYH